VLIDGFNGQGMVEFQRVIFEVFFCRKDIQSYENFAAVFTWLITKKVTVQPVSVCFTMFLCCFYASVEHIMFSGSGVYF